MTIESIMYMGIGFLFAGLIGVAVMPLVYGRAVRLTTRRLDAAHPQSMAEIQADKDLLRAEFAMSTRRLEMTVNQLENKTTRQRDELAKKDEVINQLEIERDTLNIEVIALKTRVEAAAYSTKIAEQANLVPLLPTIRQSMQEDTWTREETMSDTPVVSAQEDTWTREEGISDTLLVPTISPSIQEDTWTRDDSARDPVDQLDPACDRLAALFQGKKAGRFKKARSAQSPQLPRH
jgi:hypothetical protein